MDKRLWRAFPVDGEEYASVRSRVQLHVMEMLRKNAKGKKRSTVSRDLKLLVPYIDINSYMNGRGH